MVEVDEKNRVEEIQNIIMPRKDNFKRISNNNGTTSKSAIESSGYELATHTVKVKRTGALFDISKLWDLEGATTPNISIDKTFNNFDFKALKSNQNSTAFNRLESIDFFNQESQPNEMLR